MLMKPGLFRRDKQFARWNDERELLERVAIRTTSGRGVASICKNEGRKRGRGTGEWWALGGKKEEETNTKKEG